MTKIVFMGTPDFSSPILEALNEQYDVTAVVTQPDKPVGRKRQLTPPPVKKTALELGLPVYQPEKLNGSQEMQDIIEMNPDIIVTAAYGQLLPESLLAAPKYGAVNVHASLLPKYRGGAPIHYAVVNGDKETGVTIMYMVKKLDAGNMIAQQSIEIGPDDTVGIIHDKLSILGRDLLLDTLPSIIAGTNKSIPQDDALATYAPNISRDDEFVDFDRPAQEIHNQIRGLSPWPVAYAKLDGMNMKLWQSELAEGTGTPGEILAADKHGIIVATSDGAIRLIQIQPAGKKRMDASSYVAGLKDDLKGKIFNAE